MLTNGLHHVTERLWILLHICYKVVHRGELIGIGRAVKKFKGRKEHV